MRYRFWIKIVLSLFFNAFYLAAALCQIHDAGIQPYSIEGRVVDVDGNMPMAYVNIINKFTNKGTISNTDGYFKIEVKNKSDSIAFHYLGYNVKTIVYNSKISFVTVQLEKNASLLNEITIYSNDEYLYQLITDCKKTVNRYNKTAKVYYELESYLNNEQSELVECYYNGEILGQHLHNLKLKNGRLGLKQFNGKFIASVESSAAITSINLFGKNKYLPENPLSLSRGKLKKMYTLELLKQIKDDEGNEIDEIEFKPKKNENDLFSGLMWINSVSKKLIKVNLISANPKNPIFQLKSSMDSMLNIDYNITLWFSEWNQNTLFNHVDFNYHMKIKDKLERVSEISTLAVMQAYDYEQLFQLPHFTFNENQCSDYRDINAIPYSDFFWENIDELRAVDTKNKNRDFFNNAEITNKMIFRPGRNEYFRGGILEKPYIHWNGDRIWFRAIDSDSVSLTSVASISSSLYKLHVELFADIYQIHDSCQLNSAVILDPLRSYYRLSKDKEALCFINIYFDLMELQRREFEMEFNNSQKSKFAFDSLYNKRIKIMEDLKSKYLKEVQHGTRRKELTIWNDLVFKEIGIDNMMIFGLKKG